MPIKAFSVVPHCRLYILFFITINGNTTVMMNEIQHLETVDMMQQFHSKIRIRIFANHRRGSSRKDESDIRNLSEEQ